uniref:LIM zinc-binding domain-containing protein n=1 Tax=Anas platyrhynchos platyrhynchos TaxID=8840 RepID=A0A493TKV6_ANAPP
GSRCGGCGEPIAGRCVTAMAQRFHPEHFVCAFCLRPLAKGTFQEQEGKPYCHPTASPATAASSAEPHTWGAAP